MKDQALEKFLNEIRRQITDGESESALASLESYLNASPSLMRLRNEALLHIARLNHLLREERKGKISRSEAQSDRATLVENLLDFLKVIEKSIPQDAAPSPAAVKMSMEWTGPDPVSFQKIIGVNNLKQISWLQRGIKMSKSVCRIHTPTGFGSGFLIGTNRLMTNNHVIPSLEVATAEQTRAEFNYQQDESGGYLPSHRFRFSKKFFHTSPKSELDYTIVEIEPDADSPSLSEWGVLQLNANADPNSKEHVSIVQHPNGGLKQIVLTASQVVTTKSPFLHYTTDTMPGSSGSPVFNDVWQVIAIHHADGGTKKDSFGNAFYANEGILMSAIKAHAGSYWPSS